jgi:hypothetical protein
LRYAQIFILTRSGLCQASLAVLSLVAVIVPALPVDSHHTGNPNKNAMLRMTFLFGALGRTRSELLGFAYTKLSIARLRLAAVCPDIVLLL